MITSGLKEAVCDLATKESYGSTLRQIERETGEKGILSKGSICNILHQAGLALQEAQQQRASQVYEQDEEAKAILGHAESYIAEDFFDDLYLEDKELTEENVLELFEEIDWDPRLKVAEENETENTSNSIPFSCLTYPTALNSKENKDTILIQADEVVVLSQEKACGKYLVTYNAVVNSGEQKYYFSAPTSTQLFYQVGGLLSRLKVNDAGKKLVLISDCTEWIRYWYEGTAISEKEAILCWWHIKKRSSEYIGEAIGNLAQRRAMKEHIIKLLWRGEVTTAVDYLKEIITDWEDSISPIEIKAINKLIKLKEYLEALRPYIPNYLARVKAGEWVANTQVEKLNDFSISQRCKKKNGCRWKRKGVGAIAALEVARRNEELKEWREHKRLPQWRECEAIAA